VGYFWSHQVALLGGEAASSGCRQRLRPAGKITIFRLGRDRREEPEYAAPSVGAPMTVGSAAGGCRSLRDWPCELTVTAAARRGDGRLIGASVRRGRGLASTSIMWTERYAPPLRTCADVGHAVAWFGTPLGDDGVVPLRHRNHLAANRGCPGSSVDDADGGVLHAGRPRLTARGVSLMLVPSDARRTARAIRLYSARSAREDARVRSNGAGGSR
jgi:hypothetical protein